MRGMGAMGAMPKPGRFWVPWPSPVFPGAAMPSLESRMAAFRFPMYIGMAPGSMCLACLL